MGRRWSSYAVALPLVTVAVVLAPATGAASCLADTAPRDRWVGVTAPPVSRLVALAQSDSDPCDLVAAGADRRIWRTTDGGRSWSTSVVAPEPVVRLFTENLGAGTVLLATSAGAGERLWVSHDGARSFRAASVPGLVESRFTAATAQGATVYVAVRRPTPPGVSAASPGGVPAGVLVSHDGGSSFDGMAGATVLSPTALAVEPAGTDDLWTNNAVAAEQVGGLFRGDGPTFRPVRAERVNDLDVQPLPDGGFSVAAATAAGILRSDDGDAPSPTWRTALAGQDVGALRLEFRRPSAVMAVVGGSVRRSVDWARTFGAAGAGLPPGCAPSGLARDHGAPSTFLTRCADGSYHRYRSSGGDIAAQILDPPPTPSPGSLPNPPQGPAGGTPTDMRVLRRLRLPTYGGTTPGGGDGSLAFDGRILYYTGGPPQAGGYLYGYRDPLLRRVRVADGLALPSIPLPFVPNQTSLSYDAVRHVLYLFDLRGQRTYTVDLRSGGVRPLAAASPQRLVASWSYDWRLDRFRAIGEQGSQVLEMDRQGRTRVVCDVGQGAGKLDVSPNKLLQYSAALLSTGEGSAYVELEDDETVVQIDDACRVRRVYEHQHYVEAGWENDQMACDTVTFGVPALWIRDTQADTAIAYEIPGGYCPLPTRVAVTNPAQAHVGERATVCARLALTGAREPLAGQQLDLLVDSVLLGSVRTDGQGRGCTTYDATSLGHKPILGVFLGTLGYLPSRGTSGIDVVVAADVVRPLLPAVVVAVAEPPLPLPQPQPQPQPQPGTQQVPQPLAQAVQQAVPQGQPQPLAQANPAVVPQRQEQVQVVLVPEVQQRMQLADPLANGPGYDDYAMVRHRRRSAYPPGLLAVAAGLVTAVAAATARRVVLATDRRQPPYR